MTECDAHAVTLNHNVENHRYKEMFSKLSFGMVPDTSFPETPWTSELLPISHTGVQRRRGLRSVCPLGASQAPRGPLSSLFPWAGAINWWTSLLPGPLCGFASFYLNYCS